tara:strand:+ start:755 stop:1351 length:597 start_codon:yes stop_codon:yes gene_type:complete
MYLSNLLNKFFRVAFLLTLFLNLNQCGLYKKTDAREVPVNAKERAQKNIEEGRSIKLFGKKGGSGTFEFASSNEMWRAAIDILDFVPLTSADYGGGIVITDWYSDSGEINESVKIMVQFLSNEIRADGLKVVVYDRLCENNNLNNCQTQTNQSSLSEEIKLAILKKASVYKNITLKKKAEEYRKKKPIKNKKVKSNNE